MATNEEKSFHQRTIEGRGERLDSCPYCGNTTEVYETPQGVIDCYRCGVNQTRTQTILRGEGASREPITIKAEEPTLHQQVEDSFREDQRKGEKGGGSSGSKGRKKPVKRGRSRVEQEPAFFNGGGGGSIVVKRKVERYAEADQRVKLYIPEWFKEKLTKEAQQRTRIDNRKWSMSQVIRSAMWKHAHGIEAVKPFEYGKGDRLELQLLLYPDEKKLLDESCAAKECSHGEFIAACVKEFSA